MGRGRGRGGEDQGDGMGSQEGDAFRGEGRDCAAGVMPGESVP